jgi:mono/diheme cytochrome c family protein
VNHRTPRADGIRPQRIAVARLWAVTRYFGCCAAVALFSVLGLAACRSLGYPLENYEAAYTKADLTSPAPEPQRLADFDPAEVGRGQYLVNITGCAACHTDGALIGEPNAARPLAGSEIGIAFTNPATNALPGVVYPSNLTPDPKTGLGNWTEAQIATAIRAGSPRSGLDSGHLHVMSWPVYQKLSDRDVKAIVAYLRSIPAIEHRVPERVPPGTRAPAPYIYFGVYRSGPALTPRATAR